MPYSSSLLKGCNPWCSLQFLKRMVQLQLFEGTCQQHPVPGPSYPKLCSWAGMGLTIFSIVCIWYITKNGPCPGQDQAKILWMKVRLTVSCWLYKDLWELHVTVVCCRGYVNIVFQMHYLCRQNPKIRHPKLMPTIIVPYQTITCSLLVLCYLYATSSIEELPLLRNHFSIF